MSYSDNDPAELARTKFPGYTDEQRVKIVERARELARADGGGIALLPPVSVDALLNLADRDVQTTAKFKGEKEFTSEDTDIINMGALAFGKRGSDKPMAHRAEFVKRFGLEKFNAEMKRWGASATELTPRKNPFPKAARKAAKAARQGTLERTEFNNAINPNQIKRPKPPKLTAEERNSNPFLRGSPSWNLTAQGKLVRDNYPLAQRMAAQAGVRLP